MATKISITEKQNAFIFLLAFHSYIKNKPI